MTVINNLRQTNPSADQETQKVYFEQETLTIGSLPQFNAHKLVTFKEVRGFWQLPQSMLNKNIVPKEGTVVQVTLSTKPKPPGPKTKEGSKYMDIESMEECPKAHSRLSSEDSHSTLTHNQAGLGLVTQARQVVSHTWTSGT